MPCWVRTEAVQVLSDYREGTLAVIGRSGAVLVAVARGAALASPVAAYPSQVTLNDSFGRLSVLSQRLCRCPERCSETIPLQIVCTTSRRCHFTVQTLQHLLTP